MIKEPCSLFIRVYDLEVETSINEIITEVIALKERNTVLVGEFTITMKLT